MARTLSLLSSVSVATLVTLLGLGCTGTVGSEVSTIDEVGAMPSTPSADPSSIGSTTAGAATGSQAGKMPTEAAIPVGDTSKRGKNLPIALGNGSTTALVNHATDAGPFTVALTANQSILVRQLGNCTVEGGGTLVGSVKGPQGVGGGIFFRDGCSDAKRFTAGKAGDFSMTTAKKGHVNFDVVDVTEEAPIPIAFGEATHTGKIDFIGDEDAWTLKVTKGQTFLIRERGCTRTAGDGPMFTLRASGPVRGPQGFWRIDSCDGSKRYEVTEDGTVTLRIAGGNNVAGSYAFDVVDVNGGGVIPLTMGSEVRPGVPAAHAGRISAAGERDLYALPVTAGQTVVITQRGDCAFENGRILTMDIKGKGFQHATNFRPNGDSTDCYRVYRLLAEEDDTWTFTVDDVSRKITGTYTFDISSGAETVEEAEEVLSELEVTPAMPETVERTITIDETLLFDFASAKLKADALLPLAEVADVLGVYTDGQVQIVGHTDSVGSDASNQTLSERRAQAIRTALAELGVAEKRLTASGAGESKPIATNDTDKGRAKNRRVDITFRAQVAK